MARLNPTSKADPGGVIAITGATGFVGRHLVAALAEKGASLRVLARKPAAAEDLGDVEIIEGSVEDAGSLRQLCADADTVIHLAGLLSSSSRDAFDAVNGLGTSRLVVAAREASIKRFVLLSSLAAREPAISDYAASKRAGENVLRRGAREFSWSILRAPAVYGPGDRATLALFRQLSRARAYVPGSPDNRFSLIHVADLVGAIEALIEPGAPQGNIHELHDTNEKGYAWPELAEVASRVTGREVKCVYLPRGLVDAASGFARLWGGLTGRGTMLSGGKISELYHVDWVCRNNMLEEHTDWSPRIGLEEGFAETLEWYGEQGWLKVRRVAAPVGAAEEDDAGEPADETDTPGQTADPEAGETPAEAASDQESAEMVPEPAMPEETEGKGGDIEPGAGDTEAETPEPASDAEPVEGEPELAEESTGKAS